MLHREKNVVFQHSIPKIARAVLSSHAFFNVGIVLARLASNSTSSRSGLAKGVGDFVVLEYNTCCSAY